MTDLAGDLLGELSAVTKDAGRILLPKPLQSGDEYVFFRTCTDHERKIYSKVLAPSRVRKREDEDGNEREKKKRRVQDVFEDMKAIIESCPDFQEEKTKYFDLKRLHRDLKEGLNTIRQQMEKYEDFRRSEEVERRMEEEVSKLPFDSELEELVEEKTLEVEERKHTLQDMEEKKHEMEKNEVKLQELLEFQAMMEEELEKSEDMLEQNITALTAKQTELQDYESILMSLRYSNAITSPSPEVKKDKRYKEVQELEEECDELKAKILERDERRERVVGNSMEIKRKKEEVNQIEGELRKLQEMKEHVETQVASIKRRCLKLATEDTENVYSRILTSLITNKGASSLNELKRKISEVDSSKLLQSIYSLVANSLLKIERSGNNIAITLSL